MKSPFEMIYFYFLTLLNTILTSDLLVWLLVLNLLIYLYIYLLNVIIVENS